MNEITYKQFQEAMEKRHKLGAPSLPPKEYIDDFAYHIRKYKLTKTIIYKVSRVLFKMSKVLKSWSWKLLKVNDKLV